MPLRSAAMQTAVLMYAMANAQLRLDELTQKWNHIRVRLLFTNHLSPLLNGELPINPAGAGVIRMRSRPPRD